VAQNVNLVNNCTVGCANKNNHVGELLWSCSKIFTRFVALAEEDSIHISSIYHYNILFKSKIISKELQNENKMHISK